MLKRTVKSCGPDASAVGVKSAEGKSARPGADEPAIRRRRRQQSPIFRGALVGRIGAEGVICPPASANPTYSHLMSLLEFLRVYSGRVIVLLRSCRVHCCCR